jgi:hypothetical protein
VQHCVEEALMMKLQIEERRADEEAAKTDAVAAAERRVAEKLKARGQL